MVNSARDDPSSETMASQRDDPVRRLDEALKQIGIAREKAEVDVDEKLRAAAEELQSAQSILADD